MDWKNDIPTFEADREEITAFKVDGTYLFKQYFDRDDEFDALKSYYKMIHIDLKCQKTN